MDSERIDWRLLGKIIGIGILGFTGFISLFAVPILLGMWHPLAGLAAIWAIFTGIIPFMSHMELTWSNYLKRLPIAALVVTAFFAFFAGYTKLTVEYPNTSITVMFIVIGLMGLAMIPLMVHVAYTEAKREREKKASK